MKLKMLSGCLKCDISGEEDRFAGALCDSAATAEFRTPKTGSGRGDAPKNFQKGGNGGMQLQLLKTEYVAPCHG